MYILYRYDYNSKERKYQKKSQSLQVIKFLSSGAI